MWLWQEAGRFLFSKIIFLEETGMLFKIRQIELFSGSAFQKKRSRKIRDDCEPCTKKYSTRTQQSKN
jgi:hypothetical protein